MIALLAIHLASASPVAPTFCVEHAVDFSDVSTERAGLDDDFILDNSPIAARGVRLNIFNITLNVGTHVHASDNGCATPVLDNSFKYNIKVYAEGDIDGNEWVVRDNDSLDQKYVYLAKSNWTPTNGTIDVVTTMHGAWHISAIAGWSLDRVAGAQGQDITFYTQECPSQGGSCQRDDEVAYIAPSSDQRKYIIAHELGHVNMEACNNYKDENKDSANGSGTCDGGPNSNKFYLKHYQSQAANEGVAWYYAAMAFNDRLEADCSVGRCLDWNQDGDCDDAYGVGIEEASPSCEGKAAEPWSNLDFLGHHCTGTIVDRATRFDYLRAFWDLTQDAPGGNGQGLFFGDVCEVWDTANPHTWDADGGGSSSDNPEDRLRNAAVGMGIGNKWDNVDNPNGIHR